MKVTQGLFEFNWDTVFALITFLVLFLILKHFFFEKVHNFMVERSESIQKSIDNAAEKNRRADEKMEKYETKISNAEEEGRQIISEARKRANAQADRIIDDANAKADAAVKHSQQEIERQENSARRQLRQEVGDLAVQAAGKILERELTPEDHSEIIDQVLQEADQKKQNQ